MRFRFTPAALVLSATLLVPHLAAAQETADATLTTGRRSIQLGNLSGAGASFGFWRMRSETTNLGILLGVNTSFSHVENDELDVESNDFGLSLSVGPELRRYTSTEGRVAPYGFVGGNVNASVDRASNETDSRTDWRAGLGARAGLGVEFFPVEKISIGGQMGVGAALSYFPESDFDETSRWSVSLGTFGASLMASVYF